MNKNYDYKELTPFKWFVLQNFPFIDEDFDAITNYQLFCKLGEEINKLIESMNLTGEQVEELTNAFNNLKDYVDNYFDNLDVQDEINNKLNEMASNGTLLNIMMPFIDGIEQDMNILKNETNTQINQQNIKINNLESKITSLSFAPVVVSSTSDMTDENKIYILISSGEWYYYDSTSEQFVVGGTYQAQSIGVGSIEYTMFDANLLQICKIRIPTYTITSGKYIHKRLLYADASTFSYTSPIRLKQNDKIRFTTSLGNTTSEVGLNSGLTRTDSEGNPIQNLYTDEDKVVGNHIYEFKAEFDMYVVISTRTTISDILIFDDYDKNNSVSYDSFNKILKNQINNIRIPSYTINTSQYINKNSTIAEDVNNFMVSSPILIHAGECVILRCITATNQSEQNLVCPLAESDENGNIIRILSNSKKYSQQNNYKWVASEDTYIRFCFRLFYDYMYICKADITNEISNSGMFTLFKNCLCLGDSLTRGYFANYDADVRNRDFGYPWALSRMTRLNVYNYGRSGATPTSLWNNIQSFDFSDMDLALICLGRNGSLSLSEDQENYTNIINKLKSDNPHMTIFCLSIPYSAGASGDITINTRIKEIADANNVPYVDIYTDSYCEDSKYRPVDNVHFNTMGYNLLAKTIYERINRYIISHESDFDNLWIPRTYDNYINGLVQ